MYMSVQSFLPSGIGGQQHSSPTYTSMAEVSYEEFPCTFPTRRRFDAIISDERQSGVFETLISDHECQSGLFESVRPKQEDYLFKGNEQYLHLPENISYGFENSSHSHHNRYQSAAQTHHNRCQTAAQTHDKRCQTVAQTPQQAPDSSPDTPQQVPDSSPDTPQQGARH